jgi:hypothetical protein
MTRIAHCCCGSLRAEATGEPALLGVCHWTECQRRTGSAFGVGTYFPKEQVRAEGRARSTCAGATQGERSSSISAPNCGSTVFWYSEHALYIWGRGHNLAGLSRIVFQQAFRRMPPGACLKIMS